MNYVYVNRGRHLYECLIICLRKNTSEIRLDLVRLDLVFVTLINLFMKTFANQQDNNLPLDCAFGSFTYVCCENCMSIFSAFVLNLSKSGSILFRSMPNENCLFSSTSFLLVGDKSLVHELAAVELHVNATY